MLYDTEKAKLLGSWRPGRFAREHALYRTNKGRLFAVVASVLGGGQLLPFETREDATVFLAANGGVHLIAEHFTDVVEEA